MRNDFMSYKPQEIEKKWQEFWEKERIFKAEDFSKKPKKYILIEFPYPSGEGLHVGHVRSYSALDSLARKKRMEGYNVLFPIGWDAFGLPTENYAIKTGVHPQKATENNVANYRRQLKSLGLSFDWSREINTTDPEYYKWTQWIFLKFFEKGLAYQAEIPVNWCPSCKIGLANEEVVGGACERCGAAVEKKTLKQWMLKITTYADRLLEDLGKVDYPERVKTQQREWIGRSEGWEEDWQTEGMDLKLKTFTTWPHTTWGTTFMVIAPEHPIIDTLVKGTKYEKGAKEFCQRVIQEKIKDPINVEKKKEGFFVGRYAINHLSGYRVPLYIANFAIYEYGTGIVKCTPAHDQRDWEFAKEYNLEITPVIYPADGEKLDIKKMTEAYVGEGIMMNAGQFDGMPTGKAREAIANYIIKQGNGRKAVYYKLRDWVFSRQHYWGEPIPIIHCSKCGIVPVSEKDLPVELPYVEKYQPTGTGESPLAVISDWVNVKCPKCGGKAKRETDTMPNWAGSNWYYMRYCDPGNDKSLADSKKLKYWMPVDWYNGGMEHTTLHLLYSRFIYKFLYDIKAAPQPEPYQKRTSHGVVLAEDGRKMSKSFDNVINPDEIIQQFGADTLRMYEMFMGPFDQTIAWSTQGVKGVHRFLKKTWKLVSEWSENKKSSREVEIALHKLNKKIDEDLEVIKFNTIVSAFMGFVNLAQEKKEEVGKETIEKLLILLSPFAPHISEELWWKIGNKESVFEQKWPKPDPKLFREETVTLVFQVNGKVRDRVEVEAGLLEGKARELAISREIVKNWISGKKIKKVIYVKDKLINIVV